MKRKIFSILLAMIMASGIAFAATAEAGTVTDGQIIGLEFTKNADTVISPVTVDGVSSAEINPDTFFGGLLDNYSGSFFEGGFGALTPVAFKFTDNCLTFNERLWDSTNGTSITGFNGAKSWNIPFAGFAENETQVLDSFIFSSTAPYGENKTAPTSLEIPMNEVYTSSVFLAMNQRADSSLTATVSYTDGTTEKNTVSGIGYAQRTGKYSQRLDSVTTKTEDDGSITVLENTTNKTARMAADLALNGNAVYYTDKAVDNVRDTVAEFPGDKTIGLILYEIKTDKEKIPEKITLETNAVYPVVLYSVSQGEITNAEMMETVNNARNIEAGVISDENLELLKLASSYAEILEKRNYNDDFSDIDELIKTAEFQKKLTDKAYLDISDKFNADTLIDAENEVINPATWFNGLTVNYDQFGGIPKGSFATNGIITFEEQVYNDSTSETEKTGTTYSMPVDVTGELDSVIISTEEPTDNANGATASFTVSLNEIPTSSLFTALKFEASTGFSAAVNYKDGSSDTVSVKGERYSGSTINEYGAHKDASGNIVDYDARMAAKKATGYSFYKPSTDDSGVTTAILGASSKTVGVELYEIKLDDSKIPVSVTFTSSSEWATVIYSLMQDQLTVSDMTAYLDSVKGLKILTDEDKVKAETAMFYKDFLVSVNMVSEDDYGYVDGFELQLNTTNMTNIDISDKFNADTLIDAANEVINPETWFNGLSVNYDQFGGTTKASFAANGVLTFEEQVYNDGTSETEKTGTTYSMPVDVTGDLDSVIISQEAPTVNSDPATEALTVSLKDIPTNSIFVVLKFEGSGNLTSTVTYADGSNDTATVKGTRYSGSNINTYGAHKDASGNIVDYDTRMVAKRATGYDFYKASTDTESGVTTAVKGNDGNKTVGVELYEIVTDSTKVPVSLTLKSNNTTHTVIYSVMQNNLTVSDLMTYLDSVEGLIIKTDADKAAAEKAKAYKAYLVSKNVISKSDYAYVDGFDQQMNETKLYGIDISDSFNADTLIDEAGEAIDLNTWFNGLTIDYTQFGGAKKSALAADGIITFEEKVYNEAVSSNELTGVTYEMPLETEAELDSVIITTKKPTANTDEATTSFTASLNEVYSDSLLMALKFEASSGFTADITYADGSNDKVAVKGHKFASASISGYGAHKDANGNIVDYTSRIAAKKDDTTYTFYSPLTDEETGTVTAVRQHENNVTVGMELYEIKLDDSKIPVSVTFTSSSEWATVIYSLVQNQLTVSEMTAYLDSMENLEIESEEDIESALKAMEYKEYLVSKGIIDETAYSYVDSFNSILKVQEHNYIDLSEAVDTDLMVETGASVYSAHGRETQLYQGDKIPADGLLEIKAPLNSAYSQTDINAPEIGRTFKLSGNYNGEGADAVKVAGNSQTTIEIPNSEYMGRRKALGVVLDSIAVGEAANHADNNPETDKWGYMYIDVQINYAGGTSEVANVRMYKADGYYTKHLYSNTNESYGRLDVTDGKYQFISNKNPIYIYSSNINCDMTKDVESLTFINNTSNDYHVLAITEFSYTNAELKAVDTSILDNAVVTFENAEDILKAAAAVLELHDRGVKTADNYEAVKALYETAAQKISETDDKLYCEAAVSNGTASVKLANTTDKNAAYTLILASYDSAGKLLDVNFTDDTILKAGAINKTDSVSVAVTEGAAYTLYIWDGSTSMKPVEFESYPSN